MKMNKILYAVLVFILSGLPLEAMESTGKQLRLEPQAAREESHESFFRLAQRLEYSMAKQYISRVKSTYMVHELLYASLVANFSLNWVQKCELIEIVRNRKDTPQHLLKCLDNIERQLLLGRPLHSLTLEELAILQG